MAIDEQNDDLEGALREVGDRVVVHWAADHGLVIGEEARPTRGRGGRLAAAGEDLESSGEAQ